MPKAKTAEVKFTFDSDADSKSRLTRETSKKNTPAKYYTLAMVARNKIRLITSLLTTS